MSMRLVFGIIATAIPFILQYNYILNAFYYFGAPYYDSGLFANMLWRNDPWLTVVETYGDDSYMSVHFTPFLVLINQISYFAPTYKVEFFAFFMASIYASFSLSLYYALLTLLRPRREWHCAGFAVIAAAFSFNGFITQGVWLSHFEYAIPACIFLFLLHYGLGNKGWALFFFLLCLSLREDAGFHIVAPLGLLVVLQFWRERSFKKMRGTLCYLAAAFTYSCFAWYMTFYLRDFNGSVFQWIYAGNPPYAHLTFELLYDRLKLIVQQDVYLWLSVMLTLIWTCYRRDLYWIVGFAAYVPWFIFNWTAINPNTGVLYAYYCFPFVLGMCFPLLAALWRHGKFLSRREASDALLLQTMLAVAGLLAWNIAEKKLEFAPEYWGRWGSYRLMQGEQSRNVTRDFADKLMLSDELGTVTVDDGVRSLTQGSRWQNRGLSFLQPKQTGQADTIIYMNSFGRDPATADRTDLWRIVTQNCLNGPYCVSNTTICLYTSKDPDELVVFRGFLSKKPEDPNMPYPAEGLKFCPNRDEEKDQRPDNN